ncbi:hypothetical protein DFH09DRAFT_1165871 [Mycena vulgaris]|nr:hypothetical protein DFH09DRAFT_1165871 [Mycena vulgaris]
MVVVSPPNASNMRLLGAEHGISIPWMPSMPPTIFIIPCLFRLRLLRYSNSAGIVGVATRKGGFIFRKSSSRVNIRMDRLSRILAQLHARLDLKYPPALIDKHIYCSHQIADDLHLLSLIRNYLPTYLILIKPFINYAANSPRVIIMSREDPFAPKIKAH